jgi:hypothetical protein
LEKLAPARAEESGPVEQLASRSIRRFAQIECQLGWGRSDRQTMFPALHDQFPSEWRTGGIVGNGSFPIALHESLEEGRQLDLLPGSTNSEQRVIDLGSTRSWLVAQGSECLGEADDLD